MTPHPTQMFHYRPRTGRVVDPDEIRVELQAAVGQDDRNLVACEQLAQYRQIVTHDRGKDHAVHPLAAQRVDVVPKPLDQRVRVTHQQVVTGRRGSVEHAARDLREIRIGDSEDQ